MTKRKGIHYLLLGIVLVVAGVIGWGSLNPSTPNETDQTRFNVTNAYNHIVEIAKEPHSIFDKEAHTRVRDYLVESLEALGVAPSIYTYEDVFVERSQTYEELKNIYAKIDGKNDAYIMLVTHYDTSRAKTERYAEVDGSCGAADAGYGLATILETLRVLKDQEVELVNGIKILITDGEEYGLLGAKEAVKEEEIFENVKYLINLEARGVKGPAIMFETSLNNSGVMDLYQASPKAFSYSINPEIYRLLPNGTDFSVFLEHGIRGINIAVLDSLDYYHTPDDSIEHISLPSLQHYGDQVEPIVTAFVTDPSYASDETLERTEDAIFFNLTKDVMIRYTPLVNYVLLGLILVGIGILFITNKVSGKKVVQYAGVHIGFGVVFAGVAYGVSRLVAMAMGRAFKLTYLPLVPFEEVLLVGLFVGAFVLYYVVLAKRTKTKEAKRANSLAAVVVLLLLAVVFTFALPGASYLAVFPAMVLVVGLLLVDVFARWMAAYSSYVLLIPIALVTILFVPTVYLFNCALTFGGLAATMLFVWISYLVLIPSILEMKEVIK